MKKRQLFTNLLLTTAVLLLFADFAFTQSENTVQTLKLETRSNHFKVIHANESGFSAVHVKSKSVFLRQHDNEGKVIKEWRYSKLLPFNTDGKSFSLKAVADSNRALIVIHNRKESKSAKVMAFLVNMQDMKLIKSTIYNSPTSKSKHVNTNIFEFGNDGFTLVSISRASKETTLIHAQSFSGELQIVHELSGTVNLQQRNVLINGVVTSTDGIHVYFSDYSQEKLVSIYDMTKDDYEELDIGEDKLSNVSILGLFNGEVIVIKHYDVTAGFVAYEYQKRSIKLERVRLKDWVVTQSSEKILIDSMNYTAKKANLAKFHKGELKGLLAQPPSGFMLDGIELGDSTIHVFFHHGSLFNSTFYYQNSVLPANNIPTVGYALRAFSSNVSSINFSLNLDYLSQDNFKKYTWHNLTTDRLHDFCVFKNGTALSVLYMDNKEPGLYKGDIRSDNRPVNVLDTHDFKNRGYNMEMSSSIDGKVFIPITN
ncbi:MAG: hypothetical protein ACFHU9_00830 [Fluviicola sp.]